MDETDKKLLGLLEANSRRTNLELAKALGVSEGTIRNRIAKLVKTGVVEKFTVEFSAQGLKAVILCTTEAKTPTASIASRVREIRGVRRVIEVSGNFDLVAEVTAISSDDLNRIVEAMRKTKGVKETQSMLVLAGR
jgi:DNA-binding Lrp family transcriptional regulator